MQNLRGAPSKELSSAWASPCGGFSCCRAQALERLGFSICLSLLGLSVQAQWLWLMGLVVPQHVGSSWTRD